MKSLYTLSKNRNHLASIWLVSVWTLILAATFLAGTSARAQSIYTWTNTTSGSYTNPLNWDLHALPGSLDNAVIGSGGTALYDSTMSNVVFTLELGALDGSMGNITMSGGTLSITNNSNANLLLTGYGANSSGTFTLNGGTLNIVRPSANNWFYQDGFQPGLTVGSTGTVTVNNGTLNCFCGFECGIDGVGTLNVNGGTFLDNGWFTIGRGGLSGSGFFNQTGGTAYHLKNPGTDSRVRIQYNANVPGTFTISGGTFYCAGMVLCALSASNGVATLNISGGTLYIGDGGISSGNFAGGQVQTITVSGGTFHTVLMDANSTGQGGTNTIYFNGPGTNWSWALNNQPHVNLTTSPGPGTVTFAPEAGKTITLNNEWDGSGRMAITGPGTVVFGTNNTYTGGTTISGGTLQLNYIQPAPLISGIVVNSGGTLALSVAVNSPLGTFNSGSTLSLLNNGQIIDSTFTIPSSGTLGFNASNTQSFTNNIAGAGSVVANLGANGIEVVTGSLGYSGSTMINSGLLVLGSTLNSSSAVIVTNTGTLGGSGPIGAPITVASTSGATSAHLRMGNSPMNVPGTLTVSNLTLGAGSELDVKLGTATTVGGGVNDLLAVQGNLTINPNAYLNVLPLQALTAGTYVIATYAGTLTGQFANTVGGLTGYGLSIDYSTPHQIKLNVTGSNANLTWIGVTNGVAANNWDVLTTANWTNPATSSAAFFREADAVTFDDTTRNTNVVLQTVLYPASITFNGNTNWSITGANSGRISGGTGITKNGNGTVLLAAGLGVGNDYTGPVNINGGILKMNGALSLGATNGGTIVASGATLDLNGQTPNDEPIVLQGTGFGGTNGAINNSSATAPNQSGGPRKVTLAGDTTINASGARWDMGFNTLGADGGSFAGNGFKLTKIGAQQIWMHELGDIGVGDILVNQGTLGFQYTIGMGDPSKTITVMPGATFGIWHAANTLSKQVVLTNGATLYSDGETGTSNALSGTVTLLGTNTLQVNQALGILNPIAGTGGFHKTGSGPLYFPSAETYSGSTFVDAGNLVLGPSGSVANSGLIALGANTVLDASRPAGGLSLGSGQMLSGAGSVAGNVSAASGAQIAPGTAIAASTLTFSNNLTLNSATNIIKLGGDPSSIGNGVNDLVNVNGALALNGVSTIQISPLGVLSSASPYSVMQYGSGAAPSAANLRVVSSSPRYNVSLVNPATTSPYIQVNMTGISGSLVWKGGVASKANLWDNTTTNWLNLGTHLRDAYFPGDTAIFDDSASTNAINLTTAALGLITLSNNATAYTVTGNGNINATLDMEGTNSFRVAISNAPVFSAITANSGTLILDVQRVGAYTNSGTLGDNGAGQGTIIKAAINTLVLAGDASLFNGTIVVTNGTLQYTNATNLGNQSSPLYVTNGGTLDLNFVVAGNKNIIAAGNGFNGQGALINSSANNLANAGVNSLTLVGDTAIGGAGRFDIGVTAFNANGFKLTELGPNANLVVGGGENNLGDIHIVAGRLGFQGNVTMGDPNKTCTIESNAVITLFGPITVSKNLAMNSGVFDSGGGANTFNGPASLVGSNFFGMRTALHITGVISGPGSLTVGRSPVNSGAASLFLDAGSPCTYTGSTIISNGYTIVVGASTSLASPLIDIINGGTLDLRALDSLTLGTGQRLIGAGTVNGNITFGNGATLAPGFPDTTTSTLTISGTLTLLPGSTNLVVVNKGTTVANDRVSGLLSLTIGGTLVINNVGNPLAVGDAIQLFSMASVFLPSGSFANVIPATPGLGLLWDFSFLNTDGTVRVKQGSGPPTTPTNMVFSVSSGQLTLSWPASYTGWTLQGQTNNPGVGITTAWRDVPGSTTTNKVIMPIGQTNGSVFFRMILK